MDTPLGRWVNGQSDAIELSKMDPKHIMIFFVMLRVLKRDVEQRVTWFRTFRPPLIPLVQGWSVLEQLDLLKELDLCGLGKEPDVSRLRDLFTVQNWNWGLDQVALLLDNIGHKMMGAAWTEHKLDKVSSSDGASSGDVATTQAATQALERVQKTVYKSPPQATIEMDFQNVRFSPGFPIVTTSLVP
ncbi:hypothetical protein NliqN6_0760 [Naganishia liquefaciens]|uniref:Uncharacterized protein n=1 Tax=Naganishia liquefaciens TaxID=104408 RepID=A0A8H3TNN1_9TREE|nr:hypothetical protein NliqN6_0760 [Naganishia liquefaciens]